MKVRIFCKSFTSDLQKEVQEFLDENPNIKITNVTQSECQSVTTLSLFYYIKGEK